MLSSGEIRNIKFTKAVGGYKQEEVDILLDKIEADYDQYERTANELQNKIQQLNKEIEGYKESQSSIQNVLLSAQKLADQIINEAKTKSTEIVKNAEANISIITAREKELSTAFEIKAGERKSQLEREINNSITIAKTKTDSIIAGAEDSVARQQILFDKLKIEVAAFKADITRTYKEHLDVLQKLPDSVPMDPKHISEVISTAIDKEPDIIEYIKPAEKNSSVKDNSYDANKGFTVADTEEPAEAEPEIDY